MCSRSVCGTELVIIGCVAIRVGFSSVVLISDDLEVICSQQMQLFRPLVVLWGYFPVSLYETKRQILNTR